ncbi:MAG: DUF1284 domain-containing protein [Chloroflexi bacterium]|nr:DUF1284 domain-containing protein [Chloroflexota bacterium]
MQAEPLVLRGHHVLCVLGFRGYGYSEQFVAGMRAIVNRLRAAPEMMVELAVGRDLVCLSCPHLVGEVCKKRGAESGEDTAAHDRRVLDWLGFRVGQRLAWSAVLDMVRQTVKPEDLPNLCRECEWSPLGACEEGLRSLLNGATVK